MPYTINYLHIPMNNTTDDNIMMLYYELRREDNVI